MWRIFMRCVLHEGATACACDLLRPGAAWRRAAGLRPGEGGHDGALGPTGGSVSERATVHNRTSFLFGPSPLSVRQLPACLPACLCVDWALACWLRVTAKWSGHGDMRALVDAERSALQAHPPCTSTSTHCGTVCVACLTGSKGCLGDTLLAVGAKAWVHPTTPRRSWGESSDLSAALRRLGN
jgi:hypothetical protein